jgi:hypothetical protein
VITLLVAWYKCLFAVSGIGHTLSRSSVSTETGWTVQLPISPPGLERYRCSVKEGWILRAATTY